MRRLFPTTLVALLFATTAAMAQDPRERLYNYEILSPNHEPKPKVEGFAKARVEERLNRGVVAARTENGAVHVSWRLLKSDNLATAFNVYRSVGGKAKKLNTKPIVASTDFTDNSPSKKATAKYWVEAAGEKSEVIVVDFGLLAVPNYKSIKLKGGVVAGRIAVADLNGDGELDYIIRHPNTNVDPGVVPPLEEVTYKIEAYLSDGTYLWTKDLGLGTEPGVWYSPFVAFDFNGDGRAEVALKTTGSDYKKNEKRRIYAGSEYLTVLDGMTGNEISSVAWPERSFRLGDVNRQNRNQIGVAFLDGKTPSILACRGTYRMMMVDAWQLNGSKLERQWRWDGDQENPVVRSQGAHNLVCGDVDDDGRDEILLGGCMLDDDGTLLWSAGLGHPDKAYLTDIDPNRKGMEVFLALEPWHDNGYGVCMVDAKTGERIWGIGHKTLHVGDGMVADIDPSHSGLECFASEAGKGGSTDKYLFSAQGERIGSNEAVPDCRNWVWWGASKIRQQPIQGLKGDIIMIADLFGDWREEVVTAVAGELRIYHTNIAATDRRVSLIQDPIYRSYVIQRSQGYPQAPVPSFYLGE